MRNAFAELVQACDAANGHPCLLIDEAGLQAVSTALDKAEAIEVHELREFVRGELLAGMRHAYRHLDTLWSSHHSDDALATQRALLHTAQYLDACIRDCAWTVVSNRMHLQDLAVVKKILSHGFDIEAAHSTYGRLVLYAIEYANMANHADEGVRMLHTLIELGARITEEDVAAAEVPAVRATLEAAHLRQQTAEAIESRPKIRRHTSWT